MVSTTGGRQNARLEAFLGPKLPLDAAVSLVGVVHMSAWRVAMLGRNYYPGTKLSRSSSERVLRHQSFVLDKKKHGISQYI